MATREEIREEVAVVLAHIDGRYWNDLTVEEASDYIKKTERVVIKVERELPDNPVKVTTHFGLTEEEVNTRQLENDCFAKVIQDQMLMAGVAVEPLILPHKPLK